MDKRTREALEASIKHWQDNVAAETHLDADTGWRSCDLCLLFYNSDCEGCPVHRKTGKDACKGSPYGKASDALYRWELGPDIAERKSAFRAAAQKELDFLISLRPVEEADASGCYAAFNAIPPVGDIEELAEHALKSALAEGVPADD